MCSLDDILGGPVRGIDILPPFLDFVDSSSARRMISTRNLQYLIQHQFRIFQRRLTQIRSFIENGVVASCDAIFGLKSEDIRGIPKCADCKTLLEGFKRLIPVKRLDWR